MAKKAVKKEEENKVIELECNIKTYMLPNLISYIKKINLKEHMLKIMEQGENVKLEDTINMLEDILTTSILENFEDSIELISLFYGVEKEIVKEWNLDVLIKALLAVKEDKGVQMVFTKFVK